MWNDPGPSIHLLFHVFSPYRGSRTIGIQNALIPFNCDVNDQIESNSVFTVKLIHLIFFHKSCFVALCWTSHCFRNTMYKFLHHCKGWRIESMKGTMKVISYGTEIRVSAGMSPKAPLHTHPMQEAHTALSPIPACRRVLDTIPSRNETNLCFTTLPCLMAGGCTYWSSQLYLSCYFLRRMMGGGQWRACGFI